MPVTYKNKGNKIYYLHHEKTKTGKPRYYFSMKDKGNLMEKIPEGYEIYEHPSNAQVFLRKKQSQVITDIENHLINKYLNTAFSIEDSYFLKFCGMIKIPFCIIKGNDIKGFFQNF